MTLREEANAIVAACLRNNTSLDDLHVSGKISDAEMRSLMIEVCSNVERVLAMREELPREVYEAVIVGWGLLTSLSWDTTTRTGGLWAAPREA